jgi:ribonuclease T1
VSGAIWRSNLATLAGKVLLYWAEYATLAAWVFCKCLRLRWGLQVGNKVVKLVLTGLVAIAAVVFGAGFSVGESPRVSTGAIAVSSLPEQGQETYRLIHQGGPFPYEKDGTVFANRERLLPLHPRGYYREYTVKTPRAKNRGARRIVCGGAPKAPDACYYTADHYASFRQIVP